MNPTPSFRRVMGLLLTFTMIAELAFSQIAMAQSQTPPAKNPFWTDANGTLWSDLNKWWNDNPSPNVPLGDDWPDFPGQDPFSPFDPGGGGGQLDPGFGNPDFGYGNNQEGTPEDNWYQTLFHSAERMNLPYEDEIDKAKQTMGWLNNDAIADNIISKGQTKAAEGALVSTLGYYLAEYLFKLVRRGELPRPLEPQQFGGFMLGGSVQLLTVAYQLERMVFQLAEVYGVLPPARFPHLRQELVGVPFLLALGGEVGIRIAHRAILSALTIRTGQQVLKKAAIEELKKSGSDTAQAVEMSAIRESLEQVAQKKYIGPVASVLIKSKEAIAMALIAILAYGYGTCLAEAVGLHAKIYFKAQAELNKYAAIQDIRADFRAKDALWLILSEVIFSDRTNMSPLDVKRFFALIDSEIPISTAAHKQLLEDFKTRIVVRNSFPIPTFYSLINQISEKTDPTDLFSQMGGMTGNSTDKKVKFSLIDQYLLQLRNESIDARLYMVRLVLAGILMKGFPSGRDFDALNTMAYELGLDLPPFSTDPNSNPSLGRDPQRMNREYISNHGRYIQLTKMMFHSVTNQNYLKLIAENKERANSQEQDKALEQLKAQQVTKALDQIKTQEPQLPPGLAVKVADIVKQQDPQTVSPATVTRIERMVKEEEKVKKSKPSEANPNRAAGQIIYQDLVDGKEYAKLFQMKNYSGYTKEFNDATLARAYTETQNHWSDFRFLAGSYKACTLIIGWGDQPIKPRDIQ